MPERVISSQASKCFKYMHRSVLLSCCGYPELPIVLTIALLRPSVLYVLRFAVLTCWCCCVAASVLCCRHRCCYCCLVVLDVLLMCCCAAAVLCGCAAVVAGVLHRTLVRAANGSGWRFQRVQLSLKKIEGPSGDVPVDQLTAEELKRFQAWKRSRLERGCIREV